MQYLLHDAGGRDAGDGCRACGTYRYEGYALQLLGLPCGCLYVVDDGPAEIVSFEFDKAAVIYEDPYTNMPGVVVNPYPSNSTLRCVVRGGTYGGRLTVTLDGVGNAKLRCVSGGDLPDNEVIEPNTMRSFEFEYTPIAPSACANDIVASAHFVEDFLNESHTARAALTSIRLQLEAIYDAPENHNPSRHVYGVGEKVKLRHCPGSASATWNILKSGLMTRLDDGDWPRGVLHYVFRRLGSTVIKPQDKYKQIYTLNSLGETGVSKHGHGIVRTTNDVIRLDGEIVHEGCDK